MQRIYTAHPALTGVFAVSVLACSPKGPGLSNGTAPSKTPGHDAAHAATGPQDPPPPPPVLTEPDPAADPSKITAPAFTYSDGAGNDYILDGKSHNIVYRPITAAQSSTGTYSGGSPWAQTLTPAQYDAIVATLTRALAATAEQTPERGKGTGLLEKTGSPAVILKMNSPLRAEVEQQLKKLAPQL